jgi:hypothetical protein
MACNASDETLANDKKTAKTVRRAARKAASRASRRG